MSCRRCIRCFVVIACVRALTCRPSRLCCVYWKVKAGTQFPQNIWQMLGCYPTAASFWNHTTTKEDHINWYAALVVLLITWGHSWCFRPCTDNCRKSFVINKIQDTGRQGVLLLGWKMNICNGNHVLAQTAAGYQSNARIGREARVTRLSLMDVCLTFLQISHGRNFTASLSILL